MRSPVSIETLPLMLQEAEAPDPLPSNDVEVRAGIEPLATLKTATAAKATKGPMVLNRMRPGLC